MGRRWKYRQGSIGFSFGRLSGRSGIDPGHWKESCRGVRRWSRLRKADQKFWIRYGGVRSHGRESTFATIILMVPSALPNCHAAGALPRWMIPAHFCGTRQISNLWIFLEYYLL